MSIPRREFLKTATAAAALASVAREVEADADQQPAAVRISS